MAASDFSPLFAAFVGTTRLVVGPLAQAAVAARQALAREGVDGAVLVFDAATGEVRDLDLRGTETEVAARYVAGPGPSSAGRGRPKLGVTAREVTLLPRHWDWLATQPGGASAALRRLVDKARSANPDPGADRARTEAAYRFMSAMAGDLPGFEEAGRALFAGDREALNQRIGAWPPDLRDQIDRYLGGPGIR